MELNFNALFREDDNEENDSIFNYKQNTLDCYFKNNKIDIVDDLWKENLNLQNTINTMIENIDKKLEYLESVIDENKYRFYMKKRKYFNSEVEFYNIYPKRSEKNRMLCFLIMIENYNNSKSKFKETQIDNFDLNFEFSESNMTKDNSILSKDLNIVLDNTIKKEEFIKLGWKNIYKRDFFDKDTLKNINFINLANILNTTNYLVKSEDPIFPCDILSVILINNKKIEKIRIDWQSHEDVKLMSTVKKYGSTNWIKISKYIEGRNALCCYLRWNNELNPNKKIGFWNYKEDLILSLGVIIFSRINNIKINWIKISEMLDYRKSDVQCRERYMNILNPELKRSHLTIEEYFFVYIKLNKKKKNWSEIAKMIPGRTDNFLARKYNMLNETIKGNELKKLMRYVIKNDKVDTDLFTVKRKQ